MKVYLRMGNDYLEDAKPYPNKAAAIAAYESTARELLRFDQRIEASIHYANSHDELDEYPDAILSIGPRGGIRVERT